MSEILPSFGFQLGVGGIGGFIVGFALKKISKLVAFVIGLFILALIYLSTQGIISINFDALMKAMAGWLGMATTGFNWIVGIISLLPFAGSFIVGFLLGLKMG